MMRAALVENIDFKRGMDPGKSLKIGKYSPEDARRRLEEISSQIQKMGFYVGRIRGGISGTRSRSGLEINFNIQLDGRVLVFDLTFEIDSAQWEIYFYESEEYHRSDNPEEAMKAVVDYIYEDGMGDVIERVERKIAEDRKQLNQIKRFTDEFGK